MTLLAPLFLAGLAALAIPLVLHLSQRARRDPVRFPALVFVRRVPFRTTERRRLRDRLLLLLRALGLALLVFAFARPFLAHGPLAVSDATNARDVVVLLDRSASMAYGDHWDRAQAAVRRVAEGLGPDDRATLVPFAATPEMAGPATGDPAQLAASLARVRPDGGATRYGPALDLARDLARQSTLPRREVVLVTDFQKSAWDGRTDRLPAGTAFRTVPVGEEPVENVAVTGVTLQRSSAAGGRVAVTARVTNLGRHEARVRARLGTGEQALEDTTVRIEAGTVSLVRFAPIALPRTPTAGWVRVDADRLPVDDEWRFVLRSIPRIAVLLVESRGAAEREVLYLRRALAIGEDPVLDATVRSTPSARDVDAAEVVVLNDAPFPAGDAGRALRRHVEAGGGLLWAIGPYAGAVPGSLRPVLGTVGAQPVDRLSSHGGALGVADYAHPIFAPYRDARGGDYGAVRVYRYRRLSPPDSARVLAWLDDGSPILTEQRLGAGRVVLWGSDFGNVWNNLPVRAVFLPTVHETIRYLAQHREPPASYEAGQVLDLGAVERPAESDLVLEAPDGSRTPVPSDATRPLALSTAGFYRLRPLSGEGGTGVPIAVNLDPAESNLAQLDRNAFEEAVRGESEAGRRAAMPAGLTLAERERRQRLWRYLALAALLVLATESLLAGVRPRGIGA